jgi:hypothetical protein
MSGTLGAYVLEPLGVRPCAAQLRLGHAQLSLVLAQSSAEELTGSRRAALDRLDDEHDNLRAVLAWYKAEETGAEAGLRLTGALWRFWDVRGHSREGREHLREALARDTASRPTAARAKALNSAGRLAWDQGDFVALRAYHEESLSLWREIGDRKGIADSLNELQRNPHDEVSEQMLNESLNDKLALLKEFSDL